MVSKMLNWHFLLMSKIFIGISAYLLIGKLLPSACVAEVLHCCCFTDMLLSFIQSHVSWLMHDFVAPVSINAWMFLLPISMFVYSLSSEPWSHFCFISTDCQECRPPVGAWLNRLAGSLLLVQISSVDVPDSSMVWAVRSLCSSLFWWTDCCVVQAVVGVGVVPFAVYGAGRSKLTYYPLVRFPGLDKCILEWTYLASPMSAKFWPWVLTLQFVMTVLTALSAWFSMYIVRINGWYIFPLAFPWLICVLAYLRF